MSKAMEQRQYVPPATPVVRAVLMVSVDQQRLEGLKREEWPGKARQMATALRPLPGVRQVEAIVFRYWREGRMKVLDGPPWQPVGALVVVEGKDEHELEINIDKVWDTAGGIDQRGVTASAVDNW